MKSGKRFKVGSIIVDFGQVYKVFKIRNQKLFFKPYFKTKENRTLICSIPIINIDKTKIRRPLSRNKLNQLLKASLKRSEVRLPGTMSRTKEVLNLNEPDKLIQVLKSLWLEKNDETINFTKNKKEIFELTTRRLMEEVAYVSHLTLLRARKKINRALERFAP